MKTTELVNALELAKLSLGANDGLVPILSHFVFSEGTVYAYNDTTALVVDLDAGIEAALNGDALLGLLKAGPGDKEVQLKLDKDGTARLKMSRGWADLPSLPLDQSTFTMPDEKPRAKITVGPAFAQAMEHAMVAMGTDSLKQEYNGVTVHCPGGKELPLLYATNNHVVARVMVRDTKYTGKCATVLPPAACALLLKLFAVGGKDLSAELLLCDSVAILETAGLIMVTRVGVAEVNTYDILIHGHTIHIAMVPVPADMQEEVAKACVLTQRDPVKECVLRFNGTTLHVEVDGMLGKLRTDLKLKASAKAGLANVDPGLLTAVLPLCTSMGVNDGRSMVFSDADDEVLFVVSSRATSSIGAPAPAATKRIPVRGKDANAIPNDPLDEIPF